jgi:hypothetical protein
MIYRPDDFAGTLKLHRRYIRAIFDIKLGYIISSPPEMDLIIPELENRDEKFDIVRLSTKSSNRIF